VNLNIAFALSMKSANAGPEDWIRTERGKSLSNRSNKWFEGRARAEYRRWANLSVVVARHLSEKVSEAPTVCPQTAWSPRTALLSSIIWREFCSGVLLAGALQRFCLRRGRDAFDLGSADGEQSSEFAKRVFGNMRDKWVLGNPGPDAK
jgi:hypothetical protein